MGRLRRALVWSGVTGSGIGLATTLLATFVSPTFTWTGNALSDLGAPVAATPWLFNDGIVIAGVVSLPFAWVLFGTANHNLERAGAVTFAGAVVALALVGVFPIGTNLHAPVAIAYFLLLTLAMWLHGTGTALAGEVRRGLTGICLGIGHVLAWLGWVVSGVSGIAIPEFTGSLLFLTWIGLTTRSVVSSTGWSTD